MEAKYRSGRHDLTPDDADDERPVDKIVRQHRAVSPPHDSRPAYPDALEEAVRRSRIFQVFVVDARRIRRARREYAESKALLPSRALLNLVTWKDLYKLLLEPPWSTKRWAVDLRTYLRLAGLATFHGIDRRISDAEHFAAIVGGIHAAVSDHPRPAPPPETLLPNLQSPIWSLATPAPAGRSVGEYNERAD
jgi:hypothetical protein